MADITDEIAAQLDVLQDIEGKMLEVLDAKLANRLKIANLKLGLEAIAEVRGQMWLAIRSERAKPDIILVN